MELYNIRKLRRSADLLFENNHMMGAFALYWIISEAILVRGLVKALWLRGVPLKEAKTFVRTLNTTAVFQGLTLSTGVHYNRYKPSMKGMKLYLTAQQMRNSIFHSGISLHDRALVHLTQFLKSYTEDPSPYWKTIHYIDPITQVPAELGNPLHDLRRIRRRFGGASTESIYKQWFDAYADPRHKGLILKRFENELDWRDEQTLLLALKADYNVFSTPQQFAKQMKTFRSNQSR